VFPKNTHGVIKKTIQTITTTTTATSTVTANLTPEELVKFMDITVASKYGNDLMTFTCTIIEEVPVPYIPSKPIYKTRCLDKLDRSCSRFRVSPRVNNQ
jgi:hypothetical protein